MRNAPVDLHMDLIFSAIVTLFNITSDELHLTPLNGFFRVAKWNTASNSLSFEKL